MTVRERVAELHAARQAFLWAQAGVGDREAAGRAYDDAVRALEPDLDEAVRIIREETLR